VGIADGTTVGITVGIADGTTVGIMVEIADGITVGIMVGIVDGTTVGITVGIADGITVGINEGATEGATEGTIDGFKVGAIVVTGGKKKKTNKPTVYQNQGGTKTILRWDKKYNKTHCKSREIREPTICRSQKRTRIINK
jgi:hypothetical protein